MPAANTQLSMQQVYDSVRSRGGPTANSLNELADAYTKNGYTVTRPQYNIGGRMVDSGNELAVNGQKLKFTAGGDAGDKNAAWYQWGTDDSGPRRKPLTLNLPAVSTPWMAAASAATPTLAPTADALTQPPAFTPPPMNVGPGLSVNQQMQDAINARLTP